MTRAERHLILSGATDLEKLPRARRAVRADALGLAGLLRRAAQPTARRGRARGPSAAAARCAWRWRRLTPAHAARRCSSPRTSRRWRPRPPAPAGGRPAGRARAGGRARAAGAPGQPPELLGPRGLPALPLPLLPRALARPARRVDPPRGPGASRPRRASARCCAAASCTCCSRSSTSSARGLPDAESVAALIERHGAPVREEDVDDLRAMVERFAGSDAARAHRRGAPGAHRAAVRVHPRAPGGGRAPARGERRGGRARHRAGRRARRGLQERRARGPRPRGAVRRAPTPRSGSCTGSPTLRAGAAARGRGALLPRAARRPGGGRVRRRGRRRARGAAAGGRARGGGGPLRAHRRARTASCARDCPGRAALCSWGPERTLAEPAVPADRPIPAFRQERGLSCDSSSTRTEGESGQMPLCFIEPQEAIRVVAESVGREARRQLLGEVVRAWVDEIPDDELAVHYAKAVEELDDDDLSMLAAWHASLEVGPPDRQQGVPPRRRSGTSASTAARRCASRPASRATTPSRPASARSRRSTPCCPGCRPSACSSWPRRRSTCTAGTARARTTSRLRCSRWRSGHAPSDPEPAARPVGVAHAPPSPGSPTATPSGSPGSAGCG